MRYSNRMTSDSYDHNKKLAYLIIQDQLRELLSVDSPKVVLKVHKFVSSSDVRVPVSNLNAQVNQVDRLVKKMANDLILNVDEQMLWDGLQR